mmetsp:Transcript_7572/g.8549  ORF Transcript_7572/g.8549 Transcript_7572/m.8549 type:complete len:94 (+) Transcript_7572:127-408(+)
MDKPEEDDKSMKSYSTFSAGKSKRGGSVCSKTSCSVDTVSKQGSEKTSGTTDTFYKKKYLELLQETEKEKKLRMQMQSEIDNLKKTLSKIKTK